jgi:hypothetical protein
MPEQNSNLPEGTDKVIVGASGSSGADSPDLGTGGMSADAEIDVLVDADTRSPMLAASTGTTGGTSASSTGSGAGTASGSGAMMDRLRSGGGKLSGQAADKARGLVTQGLERSAEALANVSRMIGDTAEGIDERLGQEYGDYARRAASTIESTANSLAAKDPDELIDDTRDFVRKSPGVALAGAAVVGFAVARLIKSGLAAGGERGDDRADNGTTGRRDRSDEA